MPIASSPISSSRAMAMGWSSSPRANCNAPRCSERSGRIRRRSNSHQITANEIETCATSEAASLYRSNMNSRWIRPAVSSSTSCPTREPLYTTSRSSFRIWPDGMSVTCLRTKTSLYSSVTVTLTTSGLRITASTSSPATPRSTFQMATATPRDSTSAYCCMGARTRRLIWSSRRLTIWK